MEVLNIFNYNFLWIWCIAIFGMLLVVWIFGYFVNYTTKCFEEQHEQNVPSKDTEVIIVGSGITGSALAVSLARDGRNVVVFEKSLREPERISGELLQPGGCHALQLLRLQGCLDGLDAQNIAGYVIHNCCSGTSVDITYQNFDGTEGGKAFHHGRFVTSLRQAVYAEPRIRLIEANVTKLIEENGIVNGVIYKSKETHELQKMRASLTVVADGCFSKLRRNLVTLPPETKSHFVGLVMKNCPQSKKGHAELILADPSPVLIYQISSTDTRILVDVRNILPKDARTYLKERIFPQLPEFLQQPFMNAIETGQLHMMPNNFLPPSPIYKKGVICLGDAFNMRHPLTGGGMSVAFHDVVIFRQLLRNISDLDDYSEVLRASYLLCMQRKIHHSFVVNILSVALYELFAANDEHLYQLKEACFKYFHLGGKCVSGPIGLLSISEPHPHLLIGHFFAVSLYAVYLTFQRKPLFTFYQNFCTAGSILLKACGIILPLIWCEVRTFILY